MGYIFCVCDGSEMVKVLRIGAMEWGSACFVSAFLAAIWTNDKTALWSMMEQEMTIDEWVEWLRKEQAVGFMLDADVWYSCEAPTDGGVVWKEVFN